MRSTRQLSVTLPIDMAAQVRARVSSGSYASESEVIRDGLRALEAREKAIEQWLREDAASIFDAMRQQPERARTIEDVSASLAAAHRKRLKTA